MSSRQTKADLLRENRQLRQRIAVFERPVAGTGPHDAEAHLRMFRTLLDRSRDAIEVVDPETHRFLDVNETACRLHGYSREELLSMHVSDINPTMGEESLKQMDRLLKQRGMVLFETTHRRKDGAELPIEVSISMVEIDREYYVVVARDITGRKKADEALVTSRDLLRTVVENIPVRVFWKDRQLNYLGCNTLFARDAGMTGPDEVVGKDDFQMGWREHAERYRTDDRQVMESGKAILDYEEPLTTSSGQKAWVRTSKVPLCDTGGKVFGMLGIFEDVTERREMEIGLRESERDYRTLAENMPGMAYRVFVREGARMKFYNDTVPETTGYTVDELNAGEVCSIEPLILDEDRPGVVAEVGKALAEKRAFTVEYRLRHKGGDVRWLAEHGMPVYGEDGAPLYIDGVIFDVTERERIQESLRQSEEKFRALVESTSDWIWETDRKGVYTYASPRVEALLGLRPEEVLGKTPFDFMPAEEAARVVPLLRKLMARKAPISQLENACLCRDGSRKTLETSGVPVLDGKGRLSGYRGIDRDISDRKRAEEELRLANRSLRVLSEVNLALVQATSEPAFLKKVTEIVVHMGGYNLAVVDYVRHDAKKSIEPVAWSGSRKRSYWAKGMTWSDTEAGRIPAAMAIRSGKVQCCADIATADVSASWREVALARGYAANLSFPLANAEGMLGALSVYAPEAGECDEKEIRILQGVADALAYGINMLRVRSEHEQHATLLREALEQSIQTIAETLAARDPYTAGHQRKVSELAVAIAREMGLPEEQVHGIDLAAGVHDLGKIHIPAEILSKPGRLNDIEYMLIKTHPQAGYDILKDVNFPWPIAEIVLQHHERLDGSGYPQGLKGDAILLEARIIAVADLIDAMSAHRPYRPARGIKAAMAELGRSRGTLYDANAVDACRRLYQEGKLPL